MVGKSILNQNGKSYVVIAQMGKDRALLHGGHDYVVINDLSYFKSTGNWSGGTYFPCFNNEKDSYRALYRALYFFKNRDFLNENEEEC